MIQYEIREICGDWAIWQQYETDQGGEEKILLILNSRANAEYIRAILEHEARYPNAAVPYCPEVADMSDEEVLAINRLCCAGGHQCHACPFSGSESLEGTCFEVERRVNGLAERYVEAARSPSPADGGSSLPEGASGADADDTNVGCKPEWISVDERLPSADEIRDEYGELVPFLVVEKDTTQPFRAFYDGFVWGDGFVKLDVTHWMSLPEPPMMKGGAE
jgi:hypothetical protein